MPNSRRHHRPERGSLLIVAMLLSAVIGISLVSYIHLSRTALNLSNRAIYNNAAMNLAEQGVEEAMYSINRMVADTTYNWSDWPNQSGNNAWRKWTAVSLSQNATAEYRVYVYNYSGTPAPIIRTRALVTLGNGGAPIEKWLEVQLSKTSKFANGLVAKNSIIFNGNNATVDSWNSEKDHNTGAARSSPVPFSDAVRNDNGTVGSISVSTTAVVTQNADVWGYVSTNGSDPTALVGTNGSILGDDSPADSNVDPARVSTTFSASFDPVTAPTTSSLANLGNIDGSNNDHMTLPRASDTIPNGTGDNAGYFIYDASKINLENKKLTINGKVLIKLNSTGTTLSVTGGGGEIGIGAGASLVIYTAGDINLEGKGVSNGVDLDSPANGIQQNELGQPINFQIWGTKTSGTQAIRIAGNGLFSGIIYAPEAAVEIEGNGAICGSVVAKDITLSGNANFHYDESLGDFGGGNPFRIAKWKELTTAASRSVYATDLTF
jgi:hypothetical protein